LRFPADARVERPTLLDAYCDLKSRHFCEGRNPERQGDWIPGQALNGKHRKGIHDASRQVGSR
jgi:hypothetical protein